MKNSTGITLVVVLVALLIFSVAALGSAAALGVAARARTDALAKRRALAVLEAQAARLVSLSCATLANGQATLDGISVTWNVTKSDTLAHATLMALARGNIVSLDAERVCP
jgi:Tfp pilus assembly protein PilV